MKWMMGCTCVWKWLSSHTAALVHWPVQRMRRFVKRGNETRSEINNNYCYTRQWLLVPIISAKLTRYFLSPSPSTQVSFLLFLNSKNRADFCMTFFFSFQLKLPMAIIRLLLSFFRPPLFPFVVIGCADAISLKIIKRHGHNTKLDELPTLQPSCTRERRKTFKPFGL